MIVMIVFIQEVERAAFRPSSLSTSIGVVSWVGLGDLAPQTLDHGQYFVIILFKQHEIW